MNMHHLNNEFSLRLMIALMHFLWQGLALGIIAFALNSIMYKRSANDRYLIQVSMLLLMVVCVPVTFFLIDVSGSRTSDSRTGVHGVTFQNEEKANAPLDIDETNDGIGAGDLEAVVVPLNDPNAETPATSRQLIAANGVNAEPAPATVASSTENTTTLTDQALQFLAQSTPYATAIYLCGVFLMLLRIVIAIWGGHRMRMSAVAVTDERLVGLVRWLSRRIGLSIVPQIVSCSRLTVPVVVGVLKPVILLPAAVLSDLREDELRAILAHELAHIRRCDMLVNLFQRCVESLLFFHPAVWYVSHQIAVERENCCDDSVVAGGQQPVEYVKALLRMAELSMSLSGNKGSTGIATLSASGNNPSQFKRRVLRMLDVSDTPRLSLPGILMFLACAMMLAGVAFASFTQDGNAARPIPEVSHSGDDEKDDDEPVTTPALKNKSTQEANLKSPELEVESDGEKYEVDVQSTCKSAETNEPVADATVRFFRLCKNPTRLELWKETTTDDKGHFSIKGSVPLDDPDFVRRCEITISKNGFASRWIFWQPDGDYSTLTLEMQPASSVTGIVTDPVGNPVAGATVYVGSKHKQHVFDAITDEMGGYEIDDLEAWEGDGVGLDGGAVSAKFMYVVHPNFERQQAKFTEVPAKVDFQFEKRVDQTRNAEQKNPDDVSKSAKWPTKITGVVTDTKGIPVPDIEFKVKAVTHFRSYAGDFGEKVFATGTAKSDVKGRYVVDTSNFPPAPAGRPFSIEVLGTQKDDFAPLETWKFMSKSSDSIPDEFGRLTLPIGGLITGRVVDSDGNPVADAAINAVSSWRGKGAWRIRNLPVAMDGTFRIVPPKDVKVMIHVTSKSSGAAAVETNTFASKDLSEPLEIKLNPGKSLTGKVVSIGGKPISGTIVVLQRYEEIFNAQVGPSTTRLRFAAKTDANGRFRLPPLTGKFDCFLASASDSDELRLTDSKIRSVFADRKTPRHVPFAIDLDTDDFKEEIIIREAEAVTLSGTVTAEDGTPSANQPMSAYTTTTKMNGHHFGLASARTDAEGKYQMQVPKHAKITINHAQFFTKKLRPKVRPREGFTGDYIRLEDVTENHDGLDFIDVTAIPAKKTPAEKKAIPKDEAKSGEIASDEPHWPATLTGEVFDHEGNPISGANVKLQLASFFRTETRDEGQKLLATINATTDSQGKYSADPSGFPAPIEGRPWCVTVTASAKDHAPAQTWSFITKSEEKLPEKPFGRIKLAPAKVITGRCIDADGKPVAGARIQGTSAASAGNGGTRISETRTDDQGRFDLIAPKSFAVKLWIASPSAGNVSVLVPKEADKPIEVKFPRATSLTGQVLARDGSPVPNMVVVITKHDRIEFLPNVHAVRFATRTDADGKFRLPPANGIFLCFLSQAFGSDELHYDETDGASLFAEGDIPIIVPQKIELTGDKAEQTITIQEAETVDVFGQLINKDESTRFDTKMQAWMDTKTTVIYILESTTTNMAGQYRLRLPVGATDVRIHPYPDARNIGLEPVEKEGNSFKKVTVESVKEPIDFKEKESD